MSKYESLKLELSKTLGEEQYATYEKFLNKWYPNWSKLEIKLKGTTIYDDEGYSFGGELDFTVLNKLGNPQSPLSPKGYRFPEQSGYRSYGEGEKLDNYEEEYELQDKFWNDVHRLPLDNVIIEKKTTYQDIEDLDAQLARLAGLDRKEQN